MRLQAQATGERVESQGAAQSLCSDPLLQILSGVLESGFFIDESICLTQYLVESGAVQADSHKTRQVVT